MSQEDALALLRSIDASLKTLVKIATSNQPKPAASDRDLDSQYGDPEVKTEPRDWTGDSCKGRRMSECPAEFLDLLAEMFDYFADKAEAANEKASNGKPKAEYNRRDAARARGWARRIRSGYKPSARPAEVESGWSSGDQSPFDDAF